MRVRGWWVPEATIALLRVIAAWLLIRHGAQELFGVFVPAGMRWSGAPPQSSPLFSAAALELAGGVFLAFGLFTRIVSLVLAILAGVAFFALYDGGGNWVLSDGDFTALYCATLLAFAVIGPSVFSLDGLWLRRRGERRGMTVSMSPWIQKQYRRHRLTR